MEQRYDAVVAVIRDGLSVTEVAEKFGVSRQSVHQWMQRYERDGLAGLAERSHRPRSSPGQMPAVIEARVVELRRQRPTWGPARLRYQLGREGVDPVPSLSGIYRALVRHRLVEPKATRKKLPTYKRWERGRPMELWQLDIVGGVLLADGTECKILTGVDDHSRFCVAAGIMERAIARAVCTVFATSLRTYGVPDEVLTDNGKVFTDRFGRRPAEVLFDRICRENGITHRLTAPASPTTTGKIERFHRTLREEFLTGRLFGDRPSAQAELDAWVHEYNTDRPHTACGTRPPASRFYLERDPSLPAHLAALDPPRIGDDWVTRKVSVNGTISVAWQVFSVGKHRDGRRVDVHVLPELLEVWDGNELIKAVLRTTKGDIRKKRAQAN